ncbi:MAG: hypothetical protein RL497_2293 [Pseudomonadota bacterium]|jgi:hypothetical protein
MFKTSKIFRTALAPMIISSSTAALGIDFFDDRVNFSGFGTVSGVQTNSNEGEYRREQQGKGADKSAYFLSDSNLGLQLTGKATSWLSATVQSLTEVRYTEDELSTRAEWAFIKVTPIEGLSIRAGKFALPNFLISDSRKVGYANTWARPANEVYGLDLLNGGLEGGDISYRIPVSDYSLTATLLGGKSAFTDTDFFTGKANQRDVNNVKALNLVWDGDWYTLRLGHLRGNPDLNPIFAIFFPDRDVSKEMYKFSGFGFTMDYNDIVVQGEAVQRRSSTSNDLIASDGQYIMGGYRIDTFLPYLQYSTRKAAEKSGVAPQKNIAVGLRWDAFSSAAIKFQIEHIDTKDTTGASFKNRTTTILFPGGSFEQALPLTKPVTTFTTSIDFVF